MGRQVAAGSIAYAQVDFYYPAGSIVRPSGITISNLGLALFLNNARQGWGLQDGTLVQDGSVSAGNIYFNEVVGSNGYYSVRLFPDRIGFWRVILTHPGFKIEQILEFDVLPAGSLSAPSQGGLIASFTKP